MNVFEISKWELVSGFRIFGMTIVNSEMPFCVFREAVLTNEVVFIRSGGPVLTPGISQVCQEAPLLDQLCGKRKRAFIEVDVSIGQSLICDQLLRRDWQISVKLRRRRQR